MLPSATTTGQQPAPGNLWGLPGGEATQQQTQQQQQGQTPPAAEAPPAGGATPPSAAEAMFQRLNTADTPPAQGADFDAQAAFDAHWKATFPDELFGSADQRKNLGNIAKQISAALLRAQNAEAAHARAHKATGSPAEAKAIEQLAALQAQVDADKPKLAKYDALAARAELMDNEPFMAEHAGAVKTLREAAEKLARKAGVDAATMDAIFGAEDELDLAKAARKIADEDARGLIVAKAREAQVKTESFRASLKDPAAALLQWKPKAVAAAGQALVKSSADAVALHRAALQAGQANFLLRTPEGMKLMQKLEADYAADAPLDPAAVIADRAHAATLPLALELAEKQAKVIEALEAELKKLNGTVPRGIFATPGAAAGETKPGMWGLGAQSVPESPFKIVKGGK